VAPYRGADDRLDVESHPVCQLKYSLEVEEYRDGEETVTRLIFLLTEREKK
jgi:hypothetical protein